MMWIGVLILGSLLAFSPADMNVGTEKQKIPCELQKDENMDCNIWKMLSGKKATPKLEYAYELSKAPLFLCKGPGCIMTFIKKSVQNSKRTSETDKKETTFYSGW